MPRDNKSNRIIRLCEKCSRKWAIKHKDEYLCGYCIALVKEKAKRGRFKHLLARAQKDPAFGKREYTILMDG